jgi:hypothetical protein
MDAENLPTGIVIPEAVEIVRVTRAVRTFLSMKTPLHVNSPAGSIINSPINMCAKEGTVMNDLLGRILDAHGGTDCWNRYEKVEATIVSGGGLFRLKGVPQDSTPRRMTVWLHQERSSVFPYGAPDQRTMFTPEKIAIEKLDGTMVAF